MKEDGRNGRCWVLALQNPDQEDRVTQGVGQQTEVANPGSRLGRKAGSAGEEGS